MLKIELSQVLHVWLVETSIFVEGIDRVLGCSSWSFEMVCWLGLVWN
jgi:hypothetical protein